MNVRSLGIALTCSLLLPFGSVRAEEPDSSGPISAVGEAPIEHGDVAGARAAALQDAMTDAATTASGQLLPSGVFSVNRDILEEIFSVDPRLLIKDYRVVKDSSLDGKARVEASIVPRTQKVREELVRHGILFDRAKRPKFGVYPFEERIEKRRVQTTRAKQLTAAWIQRMRSLGYAMEELAGKPTQVDLLVRATFAQRGQEALTVELQVSSRESKAELASIQSNYDLAKGMDLAVGKIAVQFLTKLLPEWFRLAGGGRSYEITFMGFSSYKPYAELREWMNSGRSGLLSATESMYASGKVTFQVVFDGSLAELAKVIQQQSFSSARFRLARGEGSVLQFNVQ